MVARYGMTDEFGMMQLEAETNQYLGGEVASACSPETAARVDRLAADIIRRARAKADAILAADRGVLDRLAVHLLGRESITGEEFMRVLGAGDRALGAGDSEPGEVPARA